MDNSKDWKVTLLQEDALLFDFAPDGTVRMRVLPISEWEARLAADAVGGSRPSMAEVVRQAVRADDDSGALLAGAAPSIRAAAKP
jgi:hypothetical protein